jgi:DNA mismatch repair protein MutS2
MVPFPSFEEVNHALNLAEEGEFFYRISGSIELPLTHDLRPAVNVAQLGAVLTPNDLVGLAITAKKSRQLSRQLINLADNYEQLTILPSYSEALHLSREFDDEIQNCLDDNAEILDRASAALREVRGEMRAVQVRVKRTLEEMLRSPTVMRHLQETIVTMRGDRYCLAVRAESQGQVRGIVHDVSASGATVFIEPERVLQLGNRLRQLENEEKKEIEKILIRLSSLVALHATAFVALFVALGVVDFSLAKARFAHTLSATKPLLTITPGVTIRAGRHPLLDQNIAVPLDIRLGGDFHQLVITGPNTGGKTVALKTLGLFVLMALSGLYLPAYEGTEIGFFQSVYADIGDEQSIEQSLSTFSSHMVNIIQILKEADGQSLLLFDELGAGTDPTEGAALAMAILDDLRQRNILTVATTHYSELKAYAYTTPGTLNASVEFDVETLAPTYRLLMGIPGRSNAFAIAARLGLNERLIEAASSKITSHDARVEDLISKLQLHVSAAHKEAQSLTAAREAAERLRDTLHLSHLQEEADQVEKKRKLQEEMRAYVRKVEHEVETLLNQLREYSAQGKKLKDHELTDIRKRVGAWLPEPDLKRSGKLRERHPLHVGDEARVLSLGGQTATLLEQSKKGEWLVAVGVMKMKVAETELELIRKAHKVPKPVTMVTRSSTGVKPEIDLRGVTVDEAVREVDQYLDQAVMAGYPQVTLIHGKGTGALRRGIMEYLRTHPHVKMTRGGVEGEGGTGVTVVELK